MKKKITKTVVIISAVSVVLGILLCIAGAEQNGSLRRFHGFDREYLYPRGGDNYYNDFFDDFFGDDIDDFYDDFDIYGGGNDETSL